MLILRRAPAFLSFFISRFDGALQWVPSVFNCAGDSYILEARVIYSMACVIIHEMRGVEDKEAGGDNLE
jgi:hypothetical protein